MYKINDILKTDLSTLTTNDFFNEISDAYCIDEEKYIKTLISQLNLDPQKEQRLKEKATELINNVRAQNNVEDALDALLREYNLNTHEGLMLMCLAEALLRVPDHQTADALIKDRLKGVDWENHKGKSDNKLVNFATWGLILTGKITSLDDEKETKKRPNIFKRLTQKMSEPLIRTAVNKAMKIIGQQFVLGRTMDEALKNGLKERNNGYSYSFDMLGEAALTKADAEKYFNDYMNALEAVHHEPKAKKGLPSTLSIKLSALHPRYEVAKEERVMTELFATVKNLLLKAKSLGVDVSIDAEEADRLELSLKLFEKLMRDPDLANWGGLGLVVQAYSKRCFSVLIWLTLLGRELNTRIPVRLVKGAYWDTEIKLSQANGAKDYPVYTRKESTDISYLACAKYMLSEKTKGIIYPQFATHNAQTVISILDMAGDREFEFQRLHGMGEALYNLVIVQYGLNVRIYAPVGAHKDLLPYLVRRLLENGANSSFVHQLVDPSVPVDALTMHPIKTLLKHSTIRNANIPLPRNIYENGRKNSFGINLNIVSEWQPFKKELDVYLSKTHQATPIIEGVSIQTDDIKKVYSPFDNQRVVGDVALANEAHVANAIDSLEKAWPTWNNMLPAERAVIFERFATLLETHQTELIALCSLEAGKTLQDGIDEVRESVDFCRYYAQQAKQHQIVQELSGITGEKNTFYYEGRGIFACISPWNFPLAIYMGQISAALLAGNVVLAKPAEQTALIAHRAVELLFEAGLPKDAIAFIPGSGSKLGGAICQDPRIAGVCFTGSTQTARTINQNLAHRDGPIAVLIAETGGQNAMIADSTALPEQVVNDAIHSAFVSAGQRCSALRVLYVQNEVADRVITLLKGALDELVIGIPYEYVNDLSAVIDETAKNNLLQHINDLKSQGKLLAEATLPTESAGYFVAPTIFEIDSISALKKENFGPILHVVRFDIKQLRDVIDTINATGYGLTMGVHSRNETTIEIIEKHAKVGNLYVNRNQVGAVVGVQPFGGHGLSGTGPKAGGPNYLIRFMNERSTSVNTAAIGGNTTLLSLNESK